VRWETTPGGRRPVGRRLTKSRELLDAAGALAPSDLELLDQARRLVPSITLDELAAARLAASEYGNGNFVEWCCIIDTMTNRAAEQHLPLYRVLTRGKGFGEQGYPRGKRARPVSTRIDPHEGHLLAARAVLGGDARGIARGAKHFFSPRAMDAGAAKYEKFRRGETSEPRHRVKCTAHKLLEKWSFGYATVGPHCGFNRQPGAGPTHAWVGPIEGVDAWRLMMLHPMPLGTEHSARYLAAAKFIDAMHAKATRKEPTS